MDDVKTTVTTLAEYNEIEAGIAALKERYEGRVYDVTTTTGMKEAKVARATIRTSRTDLEKIRKALKGPHLERGRKIDGDAKMINAALLEIEQPIAELIKAEEKRKADAKAEKERIERERVAEIQDKINGLRFVLSEHHPSEDIKAFVEKVNHMLAGGMCEFLEFEEMAREVAFDSIEKAAEALKKSEQREEKERLQEIEKDQLRKQAESQAVEAARLEQEREAQDKKQKELDEAEARALAEDAEDEKRQREVEVKEVEQSEWETMVLASKFSSQNEAFHEIFNIANGKHDMTADGAFQKIAAICSANIDRKV